MQATSCNTTKTYFYESTFSLEYYAIANHVTIHLFVSPICSIVDVPQRMVIFAIPESHRNKSPSA